MSAHGSRTDLTSSVHFRQVAPADIARLEKKCMPLPIPLEARRIVIRTGKWVMEVRTAVSTGTRETVGWLARHMSPQMRSLFCSISETTTQDEDVFKIWRGAITVCVGEQHETVARYWKSCRAKAISVYFDIGCWEQLKKNRHQFAK
ncbi:MAG: hypothetical protein IPP94_11595 [Ignavibacteria bacterium]|nr:hypothetical protein [Ignavibacteria bacterium]